MLLLVIRSKHCLVALTALAAIASGSGCGLLESATAGGAPAAPTAEAPQPTPTAKSGVGSVKDAGDIPDPCTLFSFEEAAGLTDREVTQVDEDGGADGDVTRFCQWQQSGGQLAIFLSRTTAADFEVTIAEAETVDGVGEDAYWHSGHLFVLYGTVQIDVYSRGASDEQNLTDAREVAKVLIPRV